MLNKRRIANIKSSRARRKLSDDEELVVIKEYEEKSILTLSEEWGVSKDTICRILKDHNVTMRKPGRQPYDTDKPYSSV